jgi:hypothetical protein
MSGPALVRGERSTVTTAERPGRRSSVPLWPESRKIRIGTRWTILVKFGAGLVRKKREL